MIDLDQLRDYVVRPTLGRLGLWSLEAERLIILTGFAESRYQYVAQVGGGPARSFWQIERDTMHDIYDNFLRFRPNLELSVNALVSSDRDFSLTWNMAFAVAMCRLVYRRSPLRLPAVDDVEAQAHIWKQAYNTAHGAGTEEKFIKLANEIKEFL